MRVVAIVQARMGAERLPGKVLLDISGKTMLERVVRRVQRTPSIHEVVVATTTNPADDAVVAATEELGLRAMRGSEEDVLARYAEAASVFDADVVVRVSADSPFVDPAVCDRVVKGFLEADPPVDYASNKLEPSFPLGLDVEAFSRDVLRAAAAEATEFFERSHVTAWIYGNPGRFSLLPVTDAVDRHGWRWTVDTPEDLEFARAVHARLAGRDDFSWLEVVAILESDPSLAAINSAVAGRPLHQG